MENESVQESLENLTTMDDDPKLYNPSSTLPTDIISFILSKLPVKSLLRFKCVSKPWLSLISSPDFTKKHLITNSSLKNSKIMWSFKEGEYMVHFPLSHLLWNETIKTCSLNDVSTDAKFEIDAKIIGSVNGLICVFVPPKLLILWNPFLRKRSIVPDSDVPVSQDLRSFGFGYDNASDEYMIVGFFASKKTRYDLLRIVKVFSFKTGEWKMIKSNKCAEFYWQEGPDITFGDGKFYWINSYGVGYRAVHSLELATEKYQSFEVPLNDKRMNYTMALSEQNLVHVLGCHLDREALVWVMKEEGVKKKVVWTKVCTIEYGKVGQLPHGMFMLNCHLFRVLDDGEIMMRQNDMFLIYNPKDGSMRYCDVECPGDGFEYFEACNFVESLVWV